MFVYVFFSSNPWIETINTCSNLCMFSIVCLYMNCRWNGSYQKGRIVVPLTGLTPPQCCACPKPGPWFPTSYVVDFFLGLLSSGKMRDDSSFCLYWLNWWQWLCPYLDQGQYQRGKAKPWPVIMSFFCDSSRNHAHIWTKVNTRGSLTKPWPAIMSFFFKSPKIMPGGGGCHVRGLT